MAVHVLMMLAKRTDDYVKSDYLAESVNTNAVVIRRGEDKAASLETMPLP